jgi:hypothetical protein
MTRPNLATISAALNANAKARARCPYLREGEELVVIWASGGIEYVHNWRWLVEDCDEDIAACFAVQVGPLKTRDLLGQLHVAQCAHSAAEPMGADDATMRAVRASVRAGL